MMVEIQIHVCFSRPLYNLKLHMITKHGEKAVHDLFHQIEKLITRSLLAVQNVIIQDKHCFELYGYDILVDQLMKPWLLEVLGPFTQGVNCVFI